MDARMQRNVCDIHHLYLTAHSLFFAAATGRANCSERTVGRNSETRELTSTVVHVTRDRD